MPTVAFGLVGSTLDRGGPDEAARWNRWRPSVALAQQPDLLLDRYELIYQPGPPGGRPSITRPPASMLEGKPATCCTATGISRKNRSNGCLRWTALVPAAWNKMSTALTDSRIPWVIASRA